jgi:hypothetical protein
MDALFSEIPLREGKKERSNGGDCEDQNNPTISF